MVAVSRLRVEAKDEPVGIDVASPRFSWIVTSGAEGVQQLSFQVNVRRVCDVTAVADEVWASGRITSRDARWVDYTGPGLEPNTRYRWDIVCETNAGTTSSWSTFRTGLLTERDWSGSRWIARHRDGAPVHLPAPLLQKEFDLGRPIMSAQLFVAAGGLADVRINGTSPCRGVLAPGFADYESVVQYDATEVAHLLNTGRNTIGAELGRGFYGISRRNTWGWERAPWHGEPCLRALLVVHHADGGRTVIATDEDWLVTDSGTEFDDLYAGETFDFGIAAAHSRPDARWSSAAAVAGPRGRLVHQRQPPIEVTSVLDPVAVNCLAPGRYLVEFPRVVAGWVRLSPPPSTAATIRVAYSETLRPDGSADNDDPHDYYDGRFQTCEVTFTPAAERQSWAPRFTYYGFRYVELSGWPEDTPPTAADIVAECVHTSVARTGEFHCSSPILGDIHRIVVDTVLNNLHGIPTDTPTFEKNGWTGDGMVAAELMLTNFDAHELLAKWVGDIVATTRGTGLPKVIAPHGGWSFDWGPTPTWNAAMPLLAWWLHLYTGDERTMQEHFETLVRHARLEFARSDDGIATTTLGDWVSPETPPGGGNPPEDPRVPATVFLHAILSTVAEIAAQLGHDEVARELGSLAAAVRRAFQVAFLDGDTLTVRGVGEEGFRQSHNVLALAFGLVPDGVQQAVADAVAADVAARGHHLNTGALGTKYLLPVLSRHGHPGTALRVAQQTTFPSWGFWLANGATTTWEHWAIESRSRGHYFLGTVDDWLFQDVAGIRPLEPGHRVFEVAPKVPDLAWARASVETTYGPVRVRWSRGPGGFEIEVDVPVGAEALVNLPSGRRERLGSGHHRLADAALVGRDDDGFDAEDVGDL